MIESFIPGRVRLRSPLLRDPAAAARVAGGLEALAGVRSVRLNRAVGSLLLEYDPRAIPLALIKEALPLFERLSELEKLPPSPGRLAEVERILGELEVLVRARQPLPFSKGSD